MVTMNKENYEKNEISKDNNIIEETTTKIRFVDLSDDGLAIEFENGNPELKSVELVSFFPKFIENKLFFFRCASNSMI